MNVQYIFDVYGVWPFLLGLAVMVLTYFAKIPVRLLASKIKNDALKALVERFILLIPIAIGIGLWYLKNYILKVAEPCTTIVASGAASGAIAIIYYNLFGKYIEQAVSKKLSKPLPIDLSDDVAALQIATDLAQGKPLESVILGSDKEKITESAPDLWAEAVKLIAELTGADKELIETVLEKLKA